MMTLTAVRRHIQCLPASLSGDGIPSIAPIEGVDLDSLSDMSETDRAKAMFNQLKQVQQAYNFGGSFKFHRDQDVSIVLNYRDIKMPS